MKKIICIALALVLTLALAVTCFAAAETATITAATGAGSDTKNVTATISGSNTDTKVYGADLTWDAEVTYTYGKTWSPSTLDYADNAEGQWTDNQASVTVENRSNAVLNAAVVFAAETGITLAEGEATVNLSCPAATVGAKGAAQTATFKLAGNLVGKESGVKVGTITVTFSAAQ